MVRRRHRILAAAALALAFSPVSPHAAYAGAGQPAPSFSFSVAFPLPMADADDPYIAFAEYQLADEALERRDYAAAEPLFDRAIAQLDRLYGAEHAYPAIARSRLAVVYQRRGQRIKAEALITQASAVIEKTIGADTRWFAQCLVTQGTLREEASDYQAAEDIDLRALAILERIGATRSVQFASLLNNLGMIAAQRKDPARAEDLFRRALTLNEELDGPDSLTVAIQFQNLGILARERGDYTSARDFYTRALRIREGRLGPNHPEVAPLLNNLANIHYAQGDVAASLDTHFRALRIQEETFGAWHGATLVSVGNIARRYAASGDLVNAIGWQRRADEVIERQLALQLAVGSERQKLAFVRSVAERTERTVSLHLREAPADSGAAALAALVLLQRKGRVLDAMADTFAAARTRGLTERDRALLDRLDKTTGELARLALTAPPAPSTTLPGPARDASRSEQADARRQRIRALESEQERLEAELSANSAEFRARRQNVTLEAVQAAIPGDAALVEFAVFRPFDPKAERNADAYGAPHYAAYVLRRDAPPRGFDLGPAAAIDAAADALRKGLRDRTRPDLNARARLLHDKVIAPLRASLGAQRLLISPDGDLNLIPFEAMIDRDGRYLIERYAISYLTSGRDLLRMQVARDARGEPVIVADPLYGEQAAGPSSMHFAPLSNTAAEAREIHKLFPEARLLTGRHASKAALAGLDAPRLLHIASHGFFLRSTIGSGAINNSATGSGAPTSPSAAGSRAIDSAVSTDNPLLRSGLALAGANLDNDASGESGILTAMEASGLNLWGTKLVTLSACDTGIGEVRNGEGVYGLRRAFVLAGAESLVMSLWPVSDYVTRQLMTAYYSGLRAGLGRGDALREARLTMLRRTRSHPHRHPYFWASFIQSGDWSALDDTAHAPATSAH
jgi:CHAT domain-containing protein/Tfp pilus assembly protein PilF